MPIIIQINPIARDISIGETTHHQDQDITLHNLSTIKATVSNVLKDVP